MLKFSSGTLSVFGEVFWQSGMAKQILHEGDTYFSKIFMVINLYGNPEGVN